MVDEHKAPRKIHAKWGFGLAPEKSATMAKRKHAVEKTLKFLNDSESPAQIDDIELFSEVRGLFTRAFKQDQWDWFIVWAKLGRPPRAICSNISQTLKSLRKSLIETDYQQVAADKRKLHTYKICKWLKNYLSEAIDWGVGCVYILSTREMPGVLKMGFTTRDPLTRVDEINRATGVLIPFGVRAAWRVDDPQFVERETHDLFAEYRIRGDREFFQIEFKEAFKKINDYLHGR